MRTRGSVTVAVLAAGAITLAGCFEVSHQCVDSTQCVRAGAAGVCEANGYCSFGDDRCGRAYGEGAGALAGTCVLGLDGSVGDATVGDATASDAAASDARSDAAVDASVDDDGDTVANTVDNCRAVANLDQHDEDGDQLGDFCDLCPHVADPDQANGDLDGLGDACDPHAGLPLNQQVLFEPFAGPSLGAWTAHAGTWAATADTMRVTGSAFARLSRPITVPVATGLVVETRATVSAATASAVNYLGLAGPVDFVAGAGAGCALYDNVGPIATPMEAMALTVGVSSPSFTSVGAFTGPLLVPLTATIKHTRSGATSDAHRCDLTVGATTRGGVYADAATPITRLGLVARNVTATYAYVFAYTD